MQEEGSGSEEAAVTFNRVHFSSASGEWETPDEVFKWANEKWGPLSLDVCATRETRKCPQYFTPEQDGLAQPWAPARCWMNPPYGRGINKWIYKAWNEATKGATVVCLLPARTDTQWFHSACVLGEIWFLKGRLKFGGAKASAPFPSMIVVFGA